MPGHGVVRLAASQASGDSRFSVQNGQVLHCVGRAPYSPQTALPGTVSRSRKTQSNPCAVLRSLSDQPGARRRACRRRNVASSSPTAAAIARPSSSVNHTAPSGPVQQLPHCVQLNRKPSAYHSCSATGRQPIGWVKYVDLQHVHGAGFWAGRQPVDVFGAIIEGGAVQHVELAHGPGMFTSQPLTHQQFHLIA